MKTPILLGVFVLFIACENDIEQVRELTAKQDSAIISIKNVEIQYTTRGLNKVMMVAPRLNRYVEDKEKSTLIFPEGMEIFFYDSVGVKSSSLRANYSIYYEDRGIWEAQYDVVAINSEGDQLDTEFLVWNRDKETISTDQLVKMSTSDGIIYGDGFISNQEFTSWEVINGRGIFNLETDE